MILLMALLACGDPEVEGPKGPWGASKATQSGKYLVELVNDPEPPVMGELFALQAKVAFPDGKPVDNAKVRLDARMPQHNHGMETDPIDDPGTCDDEGKCVHPGGVYRTRGFKYHMGGTWTVMVDIDGPTGVDSTTFLYEMR